uniref:SGNH hydrolase-type esterase domain-containing protein n=1 Tax=Biomphalaria glabrata TaxID=6526 RepID=A0A2C9M4I8_BIOGL
MSSPGERSSSVNNIVKTLSRNAQNDRPMVVFYALVGNDVCNGHPDTFDHMTTPAEMYNNTMQTLDYLCLFNFLAIKKWVAQGGQAWQLIEPVDGFHDNQMGQAFVAGVIWDDLMAMSSDIFGPVNPNNDQIGNLFGDQGGY